MNESHLRCGRRSKRRICCQAFSLLEVVATLSVLLVVAVGATTMLGSITDIGLRYRHASEENAAVRRFADAFRGDVSDSVDVVAEDSRLRLLLVCREHVVEYRWDPSSKQLLRLVRSDSNGDVPDKLLGMDVYALTDRCQPRLVVAEDRLSVILRETENSPVWIVEALR